MMTLPFAIFTFVVTWGIMIFAILPFRMGTVRTVLWNTLISGLITLCVYMLLKSGWVPLRNAIQ